MTGKQPVEPVPEGTTPLGAAKGDMTQNIDTTGTDDAVSPNAQTNLTDTNPLYRDDNPQQNLGQQGDEPATGAGFEKTNMGQMDDSEKSDYQSKLEENEQRVAENQGLDAQTTDTSGS